MIQNSSQFNISLLKNIKNNKKSSWLIAGIAVAGLILFLLLMGLLGTIKANKWNQFNWIDWLGSCIAFILIPLFLIYLIFRFSIVLYLVKVDEDDLTEEKLKLFLKIYCALALKYWVLPKIDKKEVNITLSLKRALKKISQNSDLVIRGSLIPDLLLGENSRKIHDIDLVSQSGLPKNWNKLLSWDSVDITYSDDIFAKGSILNTEFDIINAAYTPYKYISEKSGIRFTNYTYSLTNKFTQIISLLSNHEENVRQSKKDNTYEDIIFLLERQNLFSKLNFQDLKSAFISSILSNYFVSYYFNGINWEFFKDQNWNINMQNILNNLNYTQPLFREIFNDLINDNDIKKIYTTIYHLLDSKEQIIYKFIQASGNESIETKSLYQTFISQDAYDSYIKNIKMFQLQELNEAIKQFKDNSNYENMDLRIILLDSLGEKYEEAM
ncbi:MAG4530 family protein [Mycoplasma sp. HF14]